MIPAPHRDLMAPVRDRGANDIRLEAGKKHPKLCFEYEGRQFKIVIPNANTPHSDAWVRKAAEIRRLPWFGPIVAPKLNLPSPKEVKMSEIPASAKDIKWGAFRPPLPPEEPHPPRPVYEGAFDQPYLPPLRVPLDDPPAAPEKPAAVVAEGRVSFYPSNRGRMQFSIPHEIVAALGHQGAIKISRSGEGWELTPHINRKRITPQIRPEGRRLILEISQHPELSAGLAYGGYAAGYICADGIILVHRKGEFTPFRAPRPRKAAQPTGGIGSNVSTPEPAAASVPFRVPFQAAAASPEGDMREILARVGQIEKSTPYRLVKLVSGIWAWKAPLITLDEE